MTVPELPEAETICRSLRRRIKGKVIKDIRLLWPYLLKETEPEALRRWVGARLIQIRRRGKMILIDSDRRETLLIHLKMTGQLYLAPSEEPGDKHVRLTIEFDGDNLELRFRDVRKFGYVKVFETSRENQVEPLKRLGPEPLGLSAGEFISLFQGGKGRIKSLLLRQDFLAGLGNIYSDEILFRAGINPERLTDSLSSKELGRLYRAMISVLAQAIKFRGTSVRDYRDGLGEAGSFQDHLRVYGREGERCYRCRQPIKRKKIGSRSTYFCPHCQPPG
jgi:formamidopyrimidine-DNA glycosylase